MINNDKLLEQALIKQQEYLDNFKKVASLQNINFKQAKINHTENFLNELKELKIPEHSKTMFFQERITNFEFLCDEYLREIGRL